MEFLFLLFLFLLNGVFSMYEIALVSSNKTRLEAQIQEALRGGKSTKCIKSVLKQINEPEKSLSAIQIGITLIGIISGAFGGIAISAYIVPFIQCIPLFSAHAEGIAMVCTIVIITYFSLVIGELVPKSIGLSKPEKIAVLLSPFMVVITQIFYPFVWILSFSTKLINRVIGLKKTERSITEEEIKMILKESSEQGVIDKKESEMIKEVFRFSDQRANQLMTHRKDLICLRMRDTISKILECVEEHRFSRYLLISDSPDQIVGVVSVKEIVANMGSSNILDLKEIAQPPLYIPEYLHARNILELFKKEKKKFGVVVNEYGGTEGIITLHDLVESVFGDILEEDELEEERMIQRSDGSLLVDAAMNLADFMESMNIVAYEDLKEDGFTTLGGMAMFLLGRMPKTGDTFHYQHLKFEIVDMDQGRVDKLLVR
ncbi:MAG: hemolysin family protein [Bacteroidales bacterium]